MNAAFVLGGDGYIGWPLALTLALSNPARPVVIFDNLSRRRLVAEAGSDSLLPIAHPRQRISSARRTFGIDNIHFVDLDLAHYDIDDFLLEHKPSCIYHFAQQASAPYSMRSRAGALLTLQNNEMANMRLLWSIKECCPHAHLVKMGSFGQYAKSNINIGEGYFKPEYKGKIADRSLPYPRESDDFYHATKTNDSNMISVATRAWGLKVTEIMQSTVFGLNVPLLLENEHLHTRLDYDYQFGTVLNRFVAQAVAGHAITIYGTGQQRTGLMSLGDAVSSLAAMEVAAPDRAEHRFVNHVTEKDYTIAELAEKVKVLAEGLGFTVKISREEYNPRNENLMHRQLYSIEGSPLCIDKPTPMGEIIIATLRILNRFKERINPNVVAPSTRYQVHD